MNANNSNYLSEYQSNENGASLLLDIYLIPCKQGDSTIETLFTEHEILLDLADLAVQLNSYMQQRQHPSDNNGKEEHADINARTTSRYRWMSGGDGPVFGIHCSSSSTTVDSTDNTDRMNNSQRGSYMIPHLRTICRYGVCVNDEWHLIGLVLDFFQSISAASNYEIAIECWDNDDGQILLIEGAQHIPKWIDDIGPNNCSHRCWIRISSTNNLTSYDRGWSVQLLRPKDTIVVSPLPLGDVINLLANHQSLDNYDSIVENAPKEMDEAILHRICTSKSAEQAQCHRAAVVLPVSVVQLFRHRPDLISTACLMFIEHIQDPICVQNLDDYLLGTCENYAWTTIPFARTAYAMIRTATSKPDWIDEDSIVPSILLTSSVEMKRFQRQCAVEATPHLRYGIQLGARLLAGLHHCLKVPARSKSSRDTNPSLHSTLSSTERRILLHWSEVAKKCGIIDTSSNRLNSEEMDWISDAWYAGPNNTKHDLKLILQCPVFVPEIETCLTPLTFPDIGLAQQIRNELLRQHTNFQLSSNPPHHTCVDREDWMWVLSTSRDSLLSDSPQTTELMKNILSTTSEVQAESIATSTMDEMLTGVQSFMDGTSTLSGVESSKCPIPIVINPTIFMNILHTALKSRSAQALSDKLNEVTDNNINDPFFTEEDYTLMDPNEDSGSHDSDDVNIEDFMNVMDAELREGVSTSRTWEKVENVDVTDNDIAQNAHVLSNLLKSINAGCGGPGPMQNILLEMGSTVPDINPSTDDDLGVNE